jgi:hypothetical protein
MPLPRAFYSDFATGIEGRKNKQRGEEGKD